MTMRTTRFTIVTRPELKAVADEIALEHNTSRSKIISQCLEELAQRRTTALMEEGYKAMAEENKKFAKMTFELQGRVVLGGELASCD